jgi:hypothetical protein
VPPSSLRLVRNSLRILLADEDGKAETKYYLIGKVANKDESLQGNHLPELPDGTGTVLFVVEEASGVDDRFFPVVRTQAHRLLAILNPIRTDGEAYRVCTAGSMPHPSKPGRLFRKVIRVSGEDSPNVRDGMKSVAEGKPLPEKPQIPGILTYEQFLERKATLAPWQVRPRLYGLFNDESTAKLFPAAWLDFGHDIYRRLKAGEPARAQSVRRWLRWWGWPFGLGVDCAMGGGDLSAWCVYGRFGAVHIETVDTPNTRTIKAKTLELMKRWKIRPEWVCFDKAIGRVIADELREEGREVSDVGFGDGALDERYPNMRVELYGELAEAMGRAFDQSGNLRPGAKQFLDPEFSPERWRTLKKVRVVALPADVDLRQELFVLPRAQDGKDRLTLPPKDGTKSRLGVKQMLGGRSPDRADALVLARYAWERGEEYRRLSRCDGPLMY